MDILQPLPFDKWSLLGETLKRDWPNYAYYYTWIITASKWKNEDSTSKVDIFCPYGKYDTGVFVGIFSVLSVDTVKVFAFEESRDLLDKVYTETKLFNWKKANLLFGSVHESIADIVENHLKKNNCKYDVDITQSYFLSKEECLKLEFKVPDECILKKLDESHVELIHSVWPHRSRKNPELSIEYLKTFITRNTGIGLFLKKDDKLVSWILQTDCGGLGMFQTVEEHQGKGYGKIVAKAIIREIAEKKNLDSTLFIVKNNTISIKLFESLGYKQYGSVKWLNLCF